ncbi:MAG TPA: hypothetical protein VHW09_25240 [Bryobacteraceae bacterium]|nr:hypothetical protein [Bryobacteraceae bacterium]
MIDCRAPAVTGATCRLVFPMTLLDAKGNFVTGKESIMGAELQAK